MRVSGFSRIDTTIVPGLMASVVRVDCGDPLDDDVHRIMDILVRDRDSIDIVMVSSDGADPLDFPDLHKLLSGINRAGIRCGVSSACRSPTMLDDLFGAECIEFANVELDRMPSDDQMASIDMMRRYGYGFMVTATLVPGLIDEQGLRELAGCISGSRHLVLKNFDPDKSRDPSLAGTKPYGKKEFEALARSARGLAKGVCIR